MNSLRLLFIDMKKTVHIIFQTTIISAALSAVILELMFQKGPHAGINIISYFTIQSNLIVASALMLNLYYRSSPPVWLNILKSGAVIWIMVTGLVFHFLLSQIYHPAGILMFSNLLLHYLVPFAFLINWLIFEKKGTLRYKYIFIWIGYPMIYAFSSLLRGEIDGFYPYWFINPVKNYPDGAGSFLNVIIVIAALAFLFSMIGILLIPIDRLLKKRVT